MAQADIAEKNLVFDFNSAARRGGVPANQGFPPATAQGRPSPQDIFFAGFPSRAEAGMAAMQRLVVMLANPETPVITSGCSFLKVGQKRKIISEKSSPTQALMGPWATAENKKKGRRS